MPDRTWRAGWLLAAISSVALMSCPVIVRADDASATASSTGRASVEATRAENLLVLDFELNDLTLYPNVEQERERVELLGPTLREDLGRRDGLAIVAVPADAALEAAKGQGYVFDRPEVAARLGREVDARWVVTGRLHKASHLFVYLKAQLIDVTSGRVKSDFVVEVKGWGEKLTRRGVERLATQIGDTIDSLPRGDG